MLIKGYRGMLELLKSCPIIITSVKLQHYQEEEAKSAFSD